MEEGKTGEPGYDSRKTLQEEACSRLLRALHEEGLATTDLSFGLGSLSYPEEDTKADVIYVIVKGAVKLILRYRRSTQFAYLLGSWDIFDPSVLAKRLLQWPRIEAHTDCEIVKVPNTSLEQLLWKRPEIALDLITTQELRLVRYQELVACLLPRSTEVRLANILRILVRKFGRHLDKSRVAIELPLTHMDLAQLVAASRESVTASMNRLHRCKVIGKEKGRIIILDAEGLAEISRQ
jgi:CRP/FNR family transcriptional regulator, global nitrogen regulator